MCRCGHSHAQHLPDGDVFAEPANCSTCSCELYARGAPQEPLPFASTRGLPKKANP